MPPKQTTTYKSLYTLVNKEISNRIQFGNSSKYSQQLARNDDIAPVLMNSGTRVDVSAQELVRAVQSMLSEALPARIISGLTVTATDPISDSIVVAAGKGTAGGYVFELTSDLILPIPFDNFTDVFYVGLYLDSIAFLSAPDPNYVMLAKIVVPVPSFTNLVRDEYDASTIDAYIMQYQEFKFYGNANGKLEENSREILKDNIGDVLAETIVGNMTLSETLKITNSTGTLELDSSSLKINDFEGNNLAKFNQRGIFFYDTSGVELAKFTVDGAHIGNLEILPNAIQSKNYLQGVRGFQIKDDGNVEFNNLEIRGFIEATSGTIGGFTITSERLYGGIIETSANVGSGTDGVVMDTTGIRGYSSTLGLTFSLPSDGTAPTFSSGIINEVTFNISTNAVIQTSTTVGDGTINSYGILINNTGIYGCGASQHLEEANLKALIDGTIKIAGEVRATSGTIGGVTITSSGLSGGLIEGSTIRGTVIETSSSVPRVRIDSTGVYYQTSVSIGKYGTSFKYGSGTKYGAGVTAYLFNSGYPVLAVVTEQTMADIRLYNRTADPASGTHAVGDLICVNGKLKICTTAGSPGTFTIVGTQT